MTELDAVRLMVRLSGKGDVTRLTGVDSTDLAGRAQRTLRDKSLMLQSRGWHFNSLRRVTLEPDANGFIEIPTNYVYVDSDWCDILIDVTEFGSRLYNLDDNTSVFTSSITVDAIFVMEFDCLPYWFKNYVAHAAAADFVFNQTSEPSRGDLLRHQHITQLMLRAKGIADANNLRASDLTVLNDGRRRTHLGTKFGQAGSDRR